MKKLSSRQKNLLLITKEPSEYRSTGPLGSSLTYFHYCESSATHWDPLRALISNNRRAKIKFHTFRKMHISYRIK